MVTHTIYDKINKIFLFIIFSPKEFKLKIVILCNVVCLSPVYCLSVVTDSPPPLIKAYYFFDEKTL